MVAAAATLVQIPTDKLYPSEHNPRKHFDQAKIEAMASTMGTVGVLEPLVARKHPKKKDGYEIIAGDRRHRAAKEAGLAEVPVILREVSDEDLVEVMFIENLQREDLTPLEEAAAFKDMMDSKPSVHTAKAIGERIGKSAEYVWSRMKLLDLIPAAKKLLESERIQVAHAILIARLKPKDQARVIAAPDGDAYRRHQGLWEPAHDSALLTHEEQRKSEDSKDPYEGYKVCTVRELEAWIATYVRFDPDHAAKAAPLLFGDVKASIDAATKAPEPIKVINITHAFHVPPEAKDGTRTFGPRSWKRADGEAGSRKCDDSVLGVVVVGPEQGQSYHVCTAKDKCKVHWGKEINARARSRKQAKAAGTARDTAFERKRQAEERRNEDQRRREEARRELFTFAKTEILESVAAAIATAGTFEVFMQLVKAYGIRESNVLDAKELLKIELTGKAVTAEDRLRLILLARVISEGAHDYWAHESVPKAAGPFGGGIKNVLEKAKADLKAQAAGKGGK
jgi:ParB family chromosome partitioning protein